METMKTERERIARMMLINRKKETQRVDEATDHREEQLLVMTEEDAVNGDNDRDRERDRG